MQQTSLVHSYLACCMEAFLLGGTYLILCLPQIFKNTKITHDDRMQLFLFFISNACYVHTHMVEICIGKYHCIGHHGLKCFTAYGLIYTAVSDLSTYRSGKVNTEVLYIQNHLWHVALEVYCSILFLSLSTECESKSC